ncbi:MAG: hypothetical protein KGJ43_07325, partial [Acidobacteriota bacterium]|nr:hypothetical protein [Acidobacteriota bacterium]
PVACGNLYVRGNDEALLTIGAENDVIINGSLTTPTAGGVPTTSAELGLIANKFVRIFHPVEQVHGPATKTEECVRGTRRRCEEWRVRYSCSSGYTYSETTHECNYINNATECDAPSFYSAEAGKGTNTEVQIYAAMLAVNHSFVVDNFKCKIGEPMSTLQVYGAVAQKFRGPVGLFYASNGEAASGYKKNYEYDERLRASEPPHFLSPVQAPWKILRETLSKTPPG